MNRFFKHPLTNAVCISLFTGFYGVIFLAFPAHLKAQIGHTSQRFWVWWDSVLEHGAIRYIAIALILLTVLLVAILLIKRKPYDEYHTAILIKCLAVSIVFALLAIAAFFVAVLLDPIGIVSKFVLFITVNWAVVVLADLIYLILCQRR